MKFAHLNIHSLFAHVHEIADILNESEYDILALSKTWLSAQIYRIFKNC